MRSQHLPITWEGFELLPMHPGWKHEYWDGQAHISPRHRFAVATVDVAPRPVVSPCPLRPIVAGDAPGLTAAFLEAFRDTIEFCDWEPAKIEEAAKKAILGFLSGRRGEILSASCGAVVHSFADAGQAIAGAALVIRGREGSPMLDMLFVTPRWQRRKLATALVSSALNKLHRAGERMLQSRYHLGNDQSVTWHKQFGFIEEPELHLAELYYRCKKHELWRREIMGNLTERERERLVAEQERWQALASELRAIADQEGVGPASR